MNAKTALQVLIRTLKFILPSIGFTILFEILLVYFDFDLFGMLRDHVTLTSISTTFGIIVSLFDISGLNKKEVERRQREIDLKTVDANRNTKEIKSIYQCSYEYISHMYRLARKSGFTCFLVTLILLFILPSCFAQFHPMGKSIECVISIANQLREHGERESTDPSVDTQSNTDASFNNNPVTFPTNTQVSPPSQFLENPNSYFELSDEQSDLLYFKSGSYAIHDQNGSKKAATLIQKFVQDKINRQAVNEFDLNAPNSVRETISKTETSLSSISNSVELDNLIFLQLEVWQDYPKFSLAWMLANDFQKYGLEYDKVNGFFQTIEFYYGQSVFWAWTSITYKDLYDYQIKTCLHYIAMRYHDIANIAPTGSQVKQRASLLYQAFCAIENETFTPASQK